METSNQSKEITNASQLRERFRIRLYGEAAYYHNAIAQSDKTSATVYDRACDTIVACSGDVMNMTWKQACQALGFDENKHTVSSK